MSSGSNYVLNKYSDDETYSPVRAYSLARDTTISSGATIVRGIYYMWNDQGFTGKGWMYAIAGSPTNMYTGFRSDDDVAAYVAANGNLDAVFEYWAQNYTLEGWDNFYNAVGVGSGCMDVDHSSL